MQASVWVWEVSSSCYQIGGEFLKVRGLNFIPRWNSDGTQGIQVESQNGNLYRARTLK